MYRWTSGFSKDRSSGDELVLNELMGEGFRSSCDSCDLEDASRVQFFRSIDGGMEGWRFNSSQLLLPSLSLLF